MASNSDTKKHLFFQACLGSKAGSDQGLIKFKAEVNRGCECLFGLKRFSRPRFKLVKIGDVIQPLYYKNEPLEDALPHAKDDPMYDCKYCLWHLRQAEGIVLKKGPFGIGVFAAGKWKGTGPEIEPVFKAGKTKNHYLCDGSKTLKQLKNNKNWHKDAPDIITQYGGEIISDEALSSRYDITHKLVRSENSPNDQGLLALKSWLQKTKVFYKPPQEHNEWLPWQLPKAAARSNSEAVEANTKTESDISKINKMIKDKRLSVDNAQTVVSKTEVTAPYGYRFEPDENFKDTLVMDAARSRRAGAYINSVVPKGNNQWKRVSMSGSASDNTKPNVTYVRGYNGRSPNSIYVVAIRDIYPGQELIGMYGDQYFESATSQYLTHNTFPVSKSELQYLATDKYSKHCINEKYFLDHPGPSVRPEDKTY